MNAQNLSKKKSVSGQGTFTLLIVALIISVAYKIGSVYYEHKQIVHFIEELADESFAQPYEYRSKLTQRIKNKLNSHLATYNKVGVDFTLDGEHVTIDVPYSRNVNFYLFSYDFPMDVSMIRSKKKMGTKLKSIQDKVSDSYEKSVGRSQTSD